MGTIKVIDNVATLNEPVDGTFLRVSTDDSTPPTGQTYKKFTFSPAAGSFGHLVFGDTSNPIFSNRRTYWSFGWANGKLEVHLGISAKRVYSNSQECGLMVATANTIFVMRLPKICDGRTYRLVDELDLLRYIEGKIDLKELGRLAGKKRQHEIRENRMRDLEIRNRELQAENKDLETKLLEFVFLSGARGLVIACHKMNFKEILMTINSRWRFGKMRKIKSIVSSIFLNK